MPAQPPVINLAGIVMERDGTRILNRIDLRIGHGQHWVLLGPNGSGKTSLLKIMTGYEWPTSGRVEILGRLFGEVNIPQFRKSVGWVSSSLSHRMHGEVTALQAAVSGFEASIGRYREFTPEEYAVAAEMLRFVGIHALADRPWQVLSQGERQRVLIARALVNRPALLILDEPCAGLDPAAREEFLNDLEKIAAASGAPTILFVTHHIEEIRPFITHVLALADGAIAAAGDITESLDTELIARLFGPCFVLRRNGRRFWLEGTKGT